jgi:uncharacterized protein YjbI with pentapeptide repeats
LSNVTFADSDLSRANFEGAILKNACLIGAGLINANLRNADIEGVNVSDETVLEGTNYWDAVNYITSGIDEWLAVDENAPDWY